MRESRSNKSEDEMSVISSPAFHPDSRPPLRLWGLSPVELHDLYWRSRGVAVVRQGGRGELPEVEVFLLIDSSSMALFELRSAIRRLYWVDPMLLSIRLHGLVRNRLVEQRQSDSTRTSVFRRGEIANRGAVTRVGLTKHQSVAKEWQSSPTPPEAWRAFRHQIAQSRRAALSLPGVTADSHSDEEAAGVVGHIASVWQRPEQFVERAFRVDSSLWRDTGTRIDVPAKSAFPIWLGIGRSQCPDTASHGPVILWDALPDLPDDLKTSATLQGGRQ
jgi:hypothetical protein